MNSLPNNTAVTIFTFHKFPTTLEKVSPQLRDRRSPMGSTSVFHDFWQVPFLFLKYDYTAAAPPQRAGTARRIRSSPAHPAPEPLVQFSSVQSLSRVRLFVTPWIAARQASLSITNSQSSLRLMSIESVMPSSHLILCHPLLLLPPIPPSIRVFSNESTLHMRWPKYWSFSFSPSSEHPGLISFRMDWLDFLAVQGTLKSLLQHYSSKASILKVP